MAQTCGEELRVRLTDDLQSDSQSEIILLPIHLALHLSSFWCVDADNQKPNNNSTLDEIKTGHNKVNTSTNFDLKKIFN